MERLQASASHQPRIDDKTRNNVEISPPSRQSNSMCHDRSNNTMIEEKKSDSCRDGEMIDASDEDNRKPMDPYKELELYLARVIEEIDDIIIVKAPSTPLNRHRETDFSSKQSQINSNLDIANETCSNDRSLLDPSSLTIGASLNTRKSENVKLRQYPECWDERLEICKSERSAERLKNSKPLVVSCQKIDTPVTKTIPRRNNTIDDRVIDYKELLNEFGLSDSESAESESPGDNFMKKLSRDSTNGEDQSSIEIANKNILVPPKSMEMGITASYMLNPNYQEPEDLLVRGETKFSKIHHFPEKFDESHEVDALNEGEEKSRREASMLSNGSKCETSLIISSDELKNSSSLAKCSKRSRQMSRGRTSGCEIISVLPKNNRPVDLTITCENKDEKPRRFEDERKKETENRTIATMSSSSLINGSNYNRIIDKSLSNRSSEITKKLPPRQQQESRGKRVNLPTSPMTQKRRRFLQGKLTKSGPVQPENPMESLEPDYDDIFIVNQHEFVTRSKSLECPSSPRSAPVTPTDDKRLAPFSKILRKRHTPVFRERSGDAILVRVSSLPDQDLVDLTSNERSRENSISKSRNNSRESSSTRITRAISPLTLRSDLTAKRLSESDKDVSQISPVELKKFSSSRRTSVNDASVGCDLTDSVSDGSNEIARSMEKLKNVHLAKGIAALDENNSRSGSLPISLQSLFSRLRNGSGSCCPSNLPIESFVYTDIATQTSPAISPSSSFTWVSDCESPRAESQLDAHSLQEERALLDRGSPQDTVDDDNRSSSSSQDLLQSMDEISSGSISPDTNDRASPLESGIGTASPPRSTDRRLVKPSTGKKCHRKETWERIRRRPSKLSLRKERGSTDVWVRRESVHTQTRENEVHCCQDGIDSSSGLDDTLPRIKASRPTNLPLAICITGSSSLSSAELIDTLPRAPSSPSAASLQLKHEPLNIELGSKSNSAPLLENKEPGMDNRIKPIPRQPRSQSERQLSEIEAQEACKWLRAAGFPQYAQMYEDYQFPIDVSGVAKDHPFLEADSLQSLFRRLHALNRCANMKLDTHHHSHHHNTNHDKSARGDDSDEDTQCALSENWTFEKKTRRWSRVGQVSQANVERLHTIGDQTLQQPEEDDYMDEDRRRRHHCRHHRRRCVDTEEAREAKENAEEEEEEEDDAEEDEEEEEEEREGDAEEDADDTMTDSMRYKSLPMGGGGEVPGEVVIGPRFRRTGSERLRDGAKAFLRRVESLKSRRRKRQNREGVVISGPQVLDVMSMEKKMKDLNCIDVSSGRSTGIIDHHQPQPPPISSLGHTLPPYSPSNLLPSRDSSPFNLAISGITNIHNPPGFAGDDSSSYCSDGSQCGGPTPTPTRTKLNKARRFLHRGRDDQGGALSDSECQPMSWRHRYLKDANSNDTKVLASVKPLLHPQTGTKLFDASPSPSSTTNKNGCSLGSRASSLNLGKDSQRYRHDKFHHAQDQHFNDDKICSVKRDDKVHKSFRHQLREDTCVEVKNRKETTTTTMTKEVIAVYRDEKSRSPSSELVAISQEESSSTVASRDSDQEEDSPRHNKGGGGGGGGGGNVVRWHSFQRGSLYPEALDPLCSRAMASMSCGQLLVLRKLALLKLTASMERYCPTHRTGWNWELPKFIRKIKSPDYKDKTVFGVPLLVSLQRTGQALPKSIQIALRWLRANALDQVGIFRKSGVRSRIQKLKVMTETQGDAINFDGQQAFDVADLVKQYFRELPEALLTNKLSETFIAIFQHVPVELRPDAVQSVLLLLPDEHREALETLVDFLNHVASNSPYNQMTASNLAVCLAPSLFHFNHSNPNVTNRSSSVSPRRRKTVGIPDQRELSENKAAHDCLLYLIKMHRELFMVSSDMLTQCHFNYMEESVPVALEELGTEMKQDWRGYLYACTTALFKEAREKSRGWVTVNNPADTSVEMAYKKVGDGHPLRLWRVSTEVEAPPNELLHRVLRERHIWDPQLLKYRLVDKLDTNAEIFQYAAGNMSPLPARDYCVLRSWRNDLPKGACVVVETSVEHPDAQVMLGGTRGIVLASRYLIEPCGSGKSRIMHLSRVDTKGRTPEWYNKSYGHIAALHLSKIRNSFKHTTDGPESKV